MTLYSNTSIVINPFDEHKQLKVEKAKFLIELAPDFMNETARELGVGQRFDMCFALLPSSHPQITKWVSFVKDHFLWEQERFDSLQGEETEETAGLKLFLDHSLVQLAILLVKYGIGSHSTEWDTAYLAKTVPHLNRAIDAMKQSSQEMWTLDEMAQAAGLSKYQFAHSFKEHTGLSPYSWLQAYRLIRSQALLVKTDMSVLDIALACGFSSVNVYNRLFRKIYGRTPGDFRAKTS